MGVEKRAVLAVSPGNEASLTATYSESTPLDNTHLLVAVVFFSGAASDIVSNSWGATALSASANYGTSNYLGAFSIRGDGSRNSFTITLNSAKAMFKVILLAYESYSSLTLDSSAGANTSGMSVKGITPPTATKGPNRVMIAAVTSNGGLGTVSGSWTNGFESPVPVTDRFLLATQALPQTGTKPTTDTPTWTSDRGLRVATWVLEGTAASGTGPDTTPPSLAIVSPSDNQQVSGVISLVATSTDNVATLPPTVKFYLGPDLIGTATANGSTYTLAGVDTRQVDDGAYVLRAVSTDGAGNSSTAEFTLLVNNSSAPVTTPPGLYFAGRELLLPPGVDRIYQGAIRLLGSSPSLPPPTGGGTTTPPPTGAPVRVASYGPNGTHWPSRTPWVGKPNSAYDSSEEVDCTWSAIAAAIQRATTNYPNGECRILVRPGNLPGFGGGSGSTPVLQNLGALGRKWRIVVAPRDGVFSITHDNSFRLHNIKGVSFVGFCPSGADHVEASGGIDDLDANGKPIANTSPNAKSARGIVVTNVADCAVAWTKLTHFNLTANQGGNIDGFELVEAIARDNAVSNTDRMAGRNADGGYMRDVTFAGLWVAPRWRNDPGAHLDTFQASGNSGRFEAFNWLDCYLNGVSNAVIIGVGNGTESVNAMTRPFLDHTALVGGLQAANWMYPFLGGEFVPGQPAAIPMDTGPVALNGLPFKPRVRDGLISGKVVWGFDTMENTVYRAANGPAPASGSPIIDPALFTTQASFEAAGITGIPSVQKMRDMWAY